MAEADFSKHSLPGIGVIRYDKRQRAVVQKLISHCENLNEEGLSLLVDISYELAGKFSRFEMERPSSGGHSKAMQSLLLLTELLSDKGIDLMMSRADFALSRGAGYTKRKPPLAEVVSLPRVLPAPVRD